MRPLPLPAQLDRLRAVRPAPLLVVGAVMTAGWVLVPQGGFNDAVYLAVTAIAAAAAWVAVPLATRGTRTPARLIAAGLTLSAIADLLWYVITWTGNDPDSSIADVYYLSSYAMLGAAVIVLLMPLHGRRRIVDGDAIIDILTCVSVCVLVLWELAVRDTAPGTSLVGTLSRTELIYPLVDAVLIGLIVRAMTDRRARSHLGVGFGIGVACWLVGDFTYLAWDESQLFAAITSFTWMIGTLLLAASSLRLSRPPAPPVAPEHAGSGVAGRLVLAIGPLSVPPLLVILEEAIGRDPETWSLVIGMTVMIVLAFLRTERSLAAERQTRRELAISRDAALEASRAKSTFLASISHEIRTPMNGVLGLSRLLVTTELDDDQRQYAEGIQRAGDSLMFLLNEVLDFAKLEDGRIEVDKRDFDLRGVVEDVAAMVAEQAHHNGVELIASFSSDLPRALNGDPTKLRKVLLNFASNAVKFTTDGEVLIRACLESCPTRARHLDDDHGPDQVEVRFEVLDTGPGIAAGNQELLFDAFTQVAPRPTHGGPGLGLAIATSLVDAMGGRIGVDSVPGRGSTFWCTIPLALAQQQEVVTTRPSRAQPGSRVLVVDDNRTSRVVLHDMLVGWGLESDLAGSGSAALELIAESIASGAAYALVVADLRMPEMDGVELAERVRLIPGAECVPIIALVSGPEVPAASLRRAGIEVTVAKPVELSRLQSAVQRALGAAAPLPGSTENAPLGRGVVLVVDDSEVNQLVAVGTLRQLGYLTEIAADGAEAVAKVATTSYDAVLMDCRMPVLDGYQATAEIRELEDGHRVPIIALTANVVSDDREKCWRAGMDDYLVKPLGRQQLEETLARWIPTRGAPLSPTGPSQADPAVAAVPHAPASIAARGAQLR